MPDYSGMPKRTQEGLMSGAHTTGSEMLEAAWRYTEAGLIIHPISRPVEGDKRTGKAPIERKWSERTETRTEAELMRFWGKDKGIPYNIGLQCGERSGVTVLDVDDYNPAIINSLLAGVDKEKLVTSHRSPERGHIYFRYTSGLSNVKRHFIGFEVLNNGANAVLPPSNHFSGTVYKMNREVTSLNDFPVMSEGLIERINELLLISSDLEAAVSQCRPCLKNAFEENVKKKNTKFWHGSSGRDITLACMAEIYAKGAGREGLKLACKMMFRGDYDPAVTAKEINYIVDYAEKGGKPWKCETIKTKCHIATTIPDEKGKLIKLCDGCRAQPEERKQRKEIRKEREAGEKRGSKSAILYDDLSEAFIEGHHIKTLADGALRIYTDGIYKESENKYIAYNMMVKTAEDMNLLLTPKQISDALEMVKIKTPCLENDSPLNLIPVNNGVLNIETMELEEYTPDKVFLSKHPVNYNPDAAEPVKFNEMIKTTFAGMEEQIPLVQEMFGYCFYRSYFIESMFFLIGNGANGKSLLLNILSALLGGSEHCSYLSLKDITEPKNEHVLYDLFDKSANICGDTGKSRVKETDILKKITGNDHIRVRRLYKEGFDFYNHAKIILSFNRLPEVEDFSDGFKRRLRLIEFPNQFLEGEEGTNKNLDREIIDGGELEGVFLWALDGLKRLLNENKLSNPKSIADRGLEYSRKSNPMHYFVRECILHIEGGFVEKTHLLEAISDYTKYNKMPQLTAQEIKKELIKECADIGIDTREKRDQTRKGRPYGFVNITIDKEALAEKTGKKQKDPQKNETPNVMREDMVNLVKSKYKGIVEDIHVLVGDFNNRYPGYKNQYGQKAILQNAERLSERGWRI